MNNSFFDPENNNNNYNSNQQENLEEYEQISPRKKREIQKLFIILLTVGLFIGIVVSVGIVKLMNHFGLTDKTPQFEFIESK